MHLAKYLTVEVTSVSLQVLDTVYVSCDCDAIGVQHVQSGKNICKAFLCFYPFTEHMDDFESFNKI